MRIVKVLSVALGLVAAFVMGGRPYQARFWGPRPSGPIAGIL
jgi:hypothetical protein